MLIMDIGDPVLLVGVRKASPGTILKGQAVYVVGIDPVTCTYLVELAKADNAETMPAVGVAHEVFTNTKLGKIIADGDFLGIDTAKYCVGKDDFGRKLYVSETVAGDLTPLKSTSLNSTSLNVGTYKYKFNIDKFIS